MSFDLNYVLDSESVFNSVRQRVSAQAANYIRHGNIEKEITVSVLLSLLERSDSDTELDSWIMGQVQRETEAYVKNLWHFTFGYAISLVEDPDKAEDITQSVMVAFLNSRKRILYIRGWLRRTTYNLVMQNYKSGSRETELKRELDTSLRLETRSRNTDLDELREDITKEDIKRILSASEHAEWNNMHSFKTLKEYAEQHKITYSQARKRKHILLKKIKSTFLREQGWAGTPEILDYQTLKNIKRFMTTLVEYSALAGSKEIRHYCPPKLKENLLHCLDGFKNVDDWGIYMESPNQYQISIADTSIPFEPKIAVIGIRINRSNQIRIFDCYIPELIGIVPAEKIEPLPMEKGRCLLAIEDIKRLIN
ncbi:MAG: sigma-70 family RNA polymerase sigma factor [Candidatus Cloacimonadaceae bacterium]|jgi:DNA-directed RNA polymerase specialized sigma24 family protein|nr:hypothetical protein [Candidatus Cloacimonadota bacterium]MCK9243484.1 hypothetical protein [Candidatus Cloacimonadota bacterium]MDD3104437.1 sigma-70 family RNA polymerase sigma factor [Candidatus Cloacimonadota bacterium]MDY0128364.1 sigma-70 family RNA polymerase sigma factor [Candidatus Cloacimonadaceae bacterium]